MTANEARKITNKVKEDNTNSAMEKIIDKSKEYIKSAAENGLTSTIVEVRIFNVDEGLLGQKIFSYFKQLGYKLDFSIYEYMGYKYCQVTID